MRISAKTKMCIIIGDPVEQSLSPAMHNAAYEALGLDDAYVFTAAHVKAADLKTTVLAVRALGVRGLTCTIPHKIEVMQYLDEIDPNAKEIGAVNTVVNDNGYLKGYNTDWIGTVMPLEAHTSLKGKHIALIGAGGAARAMAYGVVKKGAILTIYNRTIATAQELAAELGANSKSLADIEDIKSADIIINSTSIGMGEKTNMSPVPAALLHSKQIVFDAVYKPHETQLLLDAKKAGATVIYGYEMLLHQGVAQFELYTGVKPPVDVMLKIITSHL